MSHRMLSRAWLTLIAALVSIAPATATAAEPTPSKRMVLVELFTSQGCDMCPKAEEILGELARRDPGIVPVAFHVDYFNNPWKDVFSDPLYSERQLTYHNLYTKPKPADYGLYYTPMLMIDGEQSVNGRDPAAALAAIRAARQKRPTVALDATLNRSDDGRSGTVRIQVTARSDKVEDAPMLVCAVLREDGVATAIATGENKGKTLIARYPARKTEYNFVTLRGKTPETQEFRFTVEPGWDPQALRLAVFAQDKKTGVVHQALDLPWAPAEKVPAGTAAR